MHKVALFVILLASSSLAANGTDDHNVGVIPNLAQSEGHGRMMTNLNPSLLSTAGSGQTADKQEHEQLEKDLKDAKSRFEPKYLTCDPTLKKMIQEIEIATKEHKHDMAFKKLKEMETYKPNLQHPACQQPKSDVADVPSTTPSSSDIGNRPLSPPNSVTTPSSNKNAGNGASSLVNWSMKLSLLPLFLTFSR